MLDARDHPVETNQELSVVAHIVGRELAGNQMRRIGKLSLVQRVRSR